MILDTSKFPEKAEATMEHMAVERRKRVEGKSIMDEWLMERLTDSSCSQVFNLFGKKAQVTVSKDEGREGLRGSSVVTYCWDIKRDQEGGQERRQEFNPLYLPFPNSILLLVGPA